MACAAQTWVRDVDKRKYSFSPYNTLLLSLRFTVNFNKTCVFNFEPLNLSE